MLTWREYLGKKYSDLPGVRKLHDFIVVKTNTGEVVMKVRERCYTGEWNRSPLRILNPSLPDTLLSTYSATHLHDIPEGKMADMITMYNRFIPPDHRPDYLPTLTTAAPRPSTSVSQQSTTTSSSSSSKGRRKQSKCSVEGCDGTGHRNPTRWSEGHTTRAGCPLLHVQQ